MAPASRISHRRPLTHLLPWHGWHLQNTGPGQTVSAFDNSDAVAGIDANVASVHQEGVGITGKGITIAVVDSGLEIGHEDLRVNALAKKSFNFYSNETDPSPSVQDKNIINGTLIIAKSLRC